jgi:acyl dehydratase
VAERKAVYFEDVVIGERIEGESLTVDGAEMLAFAQEWDPLPIHTDPEIAAKLFGGLTASGTHVLAMKMKLIHRSPLAGKTVIASFGYDELRFHKPVFAGDRLKLLLEATDKKASKSKPDRGVATYRIALENQDGEIVMSHLDTILMRRRGLGGD